MYPPPPCIYVFTMFRIVTQKACFSVVLLVPVCRAGTVQGCELFKRKIGSLLEHDVCLLEHKNNSMPIKAELHQRYKKCLGTYEPTRACENICTIIKVNPQCRCAEADS